MGVWKDRIAGFINRVDEVSDRVRIKWRRLQGYDKPLQIIPYLGYGTAEKLFLRGRVVENQVAVTAQQSDGRRRNFRNFVRRFATDEVPYARVRARYGGVEQIVTADDEGYFVLELSGFESGSDLAQRREISLEVVEPVARSGATEVFTGKALVPPPTAKFGVISDLDDTVITTNVNSKLKMLLNTALRNEYTRMPFKGVTAFYEALRRGASGDENNPFFYVSSSPWNLYPFLTEFLRLNSIPQGALFLKDFGNHTIFNSGDHAGHKTGNIERILRVFADLPFILIGDSGEKDPEIYREILRLFPERIKAIYIRSVNQSPERLAAIDRLAAEIAATDCQFVLAPDTEFAAAHAAGAGYIAASEMTKIREEKHSDEKAPTLSEIEKSAGESG